MLILILGVLGLFAWFTRHPESQYLERAAAWPVLGPAVAAFRTLYPAPRSRQDQKATNDGGAELVYEVEGRTEGVAADVVTRRAIWIGPDTTLHEGPDLNSSRIGSTEGYQRLSIVRQDGDWYLVGWHDTTGWVYLEDYFTSDEPPLGSAPAPVLPLQPHPPNPERLQLGRLIMGEDAEAGLMGPYTAYTDAADHELVEFCSRVADQIEPSYRLRYELDPVGRPAAAILLFERAIDYRVLQATDTSLEGLLASGHAGFGMAALYVDGRSKHAVAATLIHEITHLLNRRALGPALPPWLNEGLAEDMSASRLDASGALDWSRLAGGSARVGTLMVTGGAMGAAIQLRQSAKSESLPSIRSLLELGWEEFVRSDPKQLNYAQSSFWIRYLLSEPRLAAGFRGYLSDIAGGGSAAPDALLSRLGGDWLEHQRGFRGWLGTQDLEEQELRSTR
jgi:hypothetical protein